MTEFLAMGGYAVYVWTSFALFVLMLLWDGIAPVLKMRRLLRELARRRQREQASAARKRSGQAGGVPS